MVTNYCEKIRIKYNLAIGQVEKLNPTLRKKEKHVLHVLHYINFQLFLDLGLKIKEIHRVLEFN